MVPAWGAVRVGTWVGYGDRGGWGEGNTGTPSTVLGEGPCCSEAGPGSPAGAGVGGNMEPGALQVQTTLRARSVHPVALPVWTLRFSVKRPCKPQNGDISDK